MPGWQVLTESQGRQSGQLSERYYINLSFEFIAPYALLFSLTLELTGDPVTDSHELPTPSPPGPPAGSPVSPFSLYNP